MTAQLEAPAPTAPTADRPLRTPGGGAPADEELARRAGAGDEQAFTVLLDRHGPGLHRHTSRLLHDPRAVEECLQETFTAAWHALPGFRGGSSVRTWLFVLARLTVARHEAGARRRTATPAAPPVGPDAAAVREGIADLRDDPARTGPEAGLREALDLALTLLPPLQRSAWILVELEGLDPAEAAAVLGLAPDEVRELMHHGRTTLAGALAAWR